MVQNHRKNQKNGGSCWDSSYALVGALADPRTTRGRTAISEIAGESSSDNNQPAYAGEPASNLPARENNSKFR